MNTFTIYHSAELNTACKQKGIVFTKIAEITKSSLIDAFGWAQNHNADYAELNVRSTTIGDIIVKDTNRAFMIKGVGFEEIPYEKIDYLYALRID